MQESQITQSSNYFLPPGLLVKTDKINKENLGYIFIENHVDTHYTVNYYHRPML